MCFTVVMLLLMSARRQLCQDMRTHYFKVEGHKLFLSYSVAECTFSLLGKLEVAYAFTGTHRRAQEDVHAVCLYLSSPHILTLQ